MIRLTAFCIFIILIIVTEVTYTSFIMFNATEEIDTNFSNTQNNQSDDEIPITEFDITKLFGTPKEEYNIMRFMIYSSLGVILLVCCVQLCQFLEGIPIPPICRICNRYLTRLYMSIVNMLQYRPVRAIEDIEN